MRGLSPRIETLTRPSLREGTPPTKGEGKNHTRSMMVAVPMPPPMHSVTSAVDLLVRSSSSSTVPRIIAPVAPSGWPSADRAAH